VRDEASSAQISGAEGSVTDRIHQSDRSMPTGRTCELAAWEWPLSP